MRRRVRRRWTQDVHEETALPNAAAHRRRRSSTASWCCAPGTASSSCARRSTAQPVAIVTAAQHLRPGAGLRARLRAAQQPRLRQGRRRLPQRRQRRSTTRSTGSTSTTATSPTTRSGRLPHARDGRRLATCRAGATRAYDWQGWLPSATHAAADQPAVGLPRLAGTTSRRPASSAADDQWGYGPVHRSAGARPTGSTGARRAGRGDDRADIVAAVQDAGDRRLAGRLHAAARCSTSSATTRAPAEAVALLRGWAATAAPTASTRTATAPTRTRPRSRCSTSGGSRRRPGRRGGAGPAAPARSATWSTSCRSASTTTRARAWARPGTASPGTATCSRTSTASGATGPGRLVAGLLRRRRPRGLPETCGPRWSAAVDRCSPQQGVASVGELTYDKHIDDIRATTAGVVGVRADRLAEPPDVPAGRRLHGQPAALLRRVG